MNLQTYWLHAPIVLIAMSSIGWLALWFTRDRKKPVTTMRG
jgi:hypothetical protein